MTAVNEFYCGRRVYHLDTNHKLSSYTLVGKIVQVTKKGNVIVSMSDGTVESIPKRNLAVYPE